jgi:hypothetical protein
MTKTLIVPGLNGSGPEHWQTWLQAQMPLCQRIEQHDWAMPNVCAWSPRIEQDLQSIQSEVYIVAHSFGCLATIASSARCAEHIKGALLVAPADPEKLLVTDCALKTVLPFPSVVVASRNDPWMSFERATHWGRQWGSHLIDAGNAGHINVESGHGPWPQALTLLNSIKNRSHGAQRTRKLGRI